MKTILAIETSCDETGIAIVKGSGKLKPLIEIAANEISSQIKIHKKYGGVVPHLAAREHEKNLPIVLKHVLKAAKIEPRKIDVVAVTKGPGLSPALWRGINFAQDLARVWKKPLIGIDHMEGHLSANFLAEVGGSSTFHVPRFTFPVLALLVSGGHTELVLMRDWLKFELLGETLDDAAGEAFDKVARMLSLPYPGGPEISKLAEKGNPGAFAFPRPMIHANSPAGPVRSRTRNTSAASNGAGEYNFSFSGLKTAVLYTIRDMKKLTAKNKKDIAASFEQAVIDVLVAKTIRAAKEHGIKTVLMAGGVAANKKLRRVLAEKIAKESMFFHTPSPKLSTDNAAMIAAAAYIRLAHGQKGSRRPHLSAEPARIITDP